MKSAGSIRPEQENGGNGFAAASARNSAFYSDTSAVFYVHAWHTREIRTRTPRFKSPPEWRAFIFSGYCVWRLMFSADLVRSCVWPLVLPVSLSSTTG